MQISFSPEIYPATHSVYIRVAVWRITLILQKIFDIIFIQGKEMRKYNALEIKDKKEKINYVKLERYS